MDNASFFLLGRCFILAWVGGGHEECSVGVDPGILTLALGPNDGGRDPSVRPTVDVSHPGRGLIQAALVAAEASGGLQAEFQAWCEEGQLVSQDSSSSLVMALDGASTPARVTSGARFTPLPLRASPPTTGAPQARAPSIP